ncbi:hypothetical protein [Arthrobacter sp. efr-133-TYG-118]|uniref:hypothetical protein n=1 Tax=Arthrobacter sp. efr-133-TYG-118 TaxID=3040279 RepID=UPI002550EF46|nr:hypothetical protein [Arthrobacter sp. efr-133-TYG-118]
MNLSRTHRRLQLGFLHPPEPSVGQRIQGIQGTAAATGVSATLYLPVAVVIFVTRPLVQLHPEAYGALQKALVPDGVFHVTLVGKVMLGALGCQP